MNLGHILVRRLSKMRRTAVRVLAVALIFYIGAYVSGLVNRKLNPDPFFGTEDIWWWTVWDYISCALIVAGVGCTVAAIGLYLNGER
jgi:hypothetical protein